MIEDYIMEKRKGLSPNTLPLPIASLRLFFYMQDKVLNWKRIKKMIPTQVKKAGYSAYQNDDIKTMLISAGSKRNRTIISFLASIGCRIGAIPDLKIEHLSNMSDGCKSVLFYEGSNEEYYGFLTQEASKVLDEYLDERRKDGEHLTEKSPIFRAEYSIGIQPVKVLTLRGIGIFGNFGRIGRYQHSRILGGTLVLHLQEEQKDEKMREYSLEEVIGFLLNLLDDTYDNDTEANEKLKIIEREKIKRLRRR